MPPSDCESDDMDTAPWRCFSLIASEILRDGLLGKKNPDARIFRFGR